MLLLDLKINNAIALKILIAKGMRIFYYYYFLKNDIWTFCFVCKENPKWYTLTYILIYVL